MIAICDGQRQRYPAQHGQRDTGPLVHLTYHGSVYSEGKRFDAVSGISMLALCDAAFLTSIGRWKKTFSGRTLVRPSPHLILFQAPKPTIPSPNSPPARTWHFGHIDRQGDDLVSCRSSLYSTPTALLTAPSMAAVAAATATGQRVCTDVVQHHRRQCLAQVQYDSLQMPWLPSIILAF